MAREALMRTSLTFQAFATTTTTAGVMPTQGLGSYDRNGWVHLRASLNPPCLPISHGACVTKRSIIGGGTFTNLLILLSVVIIRVLARDCTVTTTTTQKGKPAHGKEKWVGTFATKL